MCPCSNAHVLYIIVDFVSLHFLSCMPTKKNTFWYQLHRNGIWRTDHRIVPYNYPGKSPDQDSPPPNHDNYPLDQRQTGNCAGIVPVALSRGNCLGGFIRGGGLSGNLRAYLRGLVQCFNALEALRLIAATSSHSACGNVQYRSSYVLTEDIKEVVVTKASSSKNIGIFNKRYLKEK